MRPSRRWRPVIQHASNLLILVGAVLLGSAIVIVTGMLGGRPHAAPLVALVVTPYASPTPAMHQHARATTTLSGWTADATAAVSSATLVPSTPTREPRVVPPRPRPGEGLLAPIDAVKPSTSPYTLNTAGHPAIHISVPVVGIDTGVVEVNPVAVQAGDQTVFEWVVADWAAGHHSTSANPGEGGNIVIAGHDDVRGEVFRGLHEIEVGNAVILSTDSASHTYVVQEIHLRRFTDAPLDEQLSIGAFIAPMPEERLTLVTCWPYQVDTHRLIVVAKPAS